MEPGAFGFVVVLLGTGLFGLAALMLRLAPRLKSTKRNLTAPSIPPGVTPTSDATLLVQAGGRVTYVNQAAREWFGLLEEDPNLERLARRTRPSEIFLGLCAAEGQARFSVNGLFVEASSYFVPYDGDSALLVSMHRPQVSTLGMTEGAGGAVSDQAIDIFAELSQTMAASLDLDKTLQSVLESVERLIPSDFSEVTIWNEENQNLVPYRFVGLPGLDRHLEKSNTRYNPGEGYSGYLITKHVPLLIGNVDTFRTVRPVIDRKQYPFFSYLGMPLLVAGEVVGTLELSSLNKNAFTQNDLEVLRMLAGQAAVAIHNAMLYQGEQRRVLELSGLAQLAHAVGALYDPKDLYSRLVESTKPLVDAGIIGFWIYDETQHALEARMPFIGIPPQFLSEYNLISIAPGSEGEDLIRSQETLIINDAPSDPRMELLGMNYLAQAAGIHNSVLVPLASSGRLLGYLQVANKRDYIPFDQNDLRLLSIVSGQTAIIIENATLAQQTQKRAQRAEALRRIASLVGSSATLEEILQFSVRELARLLQADSAVIFLIDENRGELRPHKDSLYGISSEAAAQMGRGALDLIKYRLATGEASGQRSYITGSVKEDNSSLIELYQPLLEALEVNSVLIVPLVARDRNLGQILLGSRTLNSFDRSDVISVDTAAGQLASAIEQSALYTQTDETLRRRVDELTALTRISRELNTTLDHEHLLQRVFDEIVSTTGANCGTILLFSFNGQSSKENDRPRAMMHIGDSHSEELSPIECKVLDDEEPLIVQDFEQQSVENPILQPPHEGIRSALIVPIAYQEQVAGLIYMHSRQPNRFDETSLEIAQTLAIQAAIAVGNAQRLLEQRQRGELLSRRVETMSKLLETTNALKLDQPLEQSLETVAYGIQESTPFNIVLISVFEYETAHLRRVAAAGMTLEQLEEARQHKQPWSGVETLARPEFRIGNSYFIPHNQVPALTPDVHLIRQSTLAPEVDSESAWHNANIMLVPLRDQNGRPLGLISVDEPRNGLVPDKPTIESLEIFASQAALVIESYQELQTLKTTSKTLQAELERSQQAQETTQKNLPSLLHKDLELTLSIRDLNQRARRIHAGMDIAEIVNRQPERSSILLALGKEIITRMDFDIVLVAEPSSGGPRLANVLGAVPQGANPEALLGQKNPLRQCLQTGENILVSNIHDSPDWLNSPLLHALDTKGFVCMSIPLESADVRHRSEPGKPSQAQQGVEACILAISLTHMVPFTVDDEQLYALLARQVSVALQNLRLLVETNRRLQEVNLLLEFSRQIGSLDLSSILNTLVDSVRRVIPYANACLVALWDNDKNCLVPQVASGYADTQSILEITYHPGEALPGQVFQKGQALRMHEIDFARHYNLPSENLLRYRNATEGRLPISTLIVPISSMARVVETKPHDTAPVVNSLGVLVLDNFKTPGAFTSEDEALVSSLAQQTALTLENARLYQASEQRAQQLQALTDLAATITSNLQSDQLVTSLLDQARTIIPYDTGTLWLRQENTLTVRAARGFEDSEERVGISVALEDSQLMKEMITTGRPIQVDDVRADYRFPSLIEPRYFSWLGVPLISKGEVIGVIALEKTEAQYYKPENVQAITTFAGQAAVALENANLYQESVSRAAELDDRSKRLGMLNRLSTELSGSLDPSYILKLTIQELLLSVNCTAVSAVLIRNGAPTVDAETPQTAENLPVPIPDAPLFERLRESGGVFSTEDAFTERGGLTSPLLTPLSAYLKARSTRALLAVPLATGADLHGVVLIHNSKPYRFTSDEVELVRTMCNQAGFAVQNATLFAETQRLYGVTRQRSTELAALFDLGVSVSQVLDEQQLVDLVFQHIFTLMKADAAMLVIRTESQTELIAQGIDHGQKVDPVTIPATGDSFSEYVIRTERALLIGDMQREKDNLPVPGYSAENLPASWLGVPLTVRGNTIGALSVQSDTADQYGESQLSLLGQVGNQLAASLDNARLFSTVQNYASDLERRVAERTAQLAREHARTETLLAIITELSTSLDMDLVLNRTLGLLNDNVGAEHSLIMLINSEEGKLFMRAALGYGGPIPKGGQASALKPNEGLAGWVISNRKPALVNDLLRDERWKQYPDNISKHRSAIAVPLMMGEDVLGVLLLYSQHEDHFSEDQLQLVQATAQQIAVTINNSQLFGLIRDQAERLGDMLRTQHIETSRSQAILEAVADGVLVTDANRVITLFNASAEKILTMERRKVLGRTLDAFIGLFGRAAQTWIETIDVWSKDPTKAVGATQAVQIVLDDKRVVSVHMAPVRLRNDFLGTVSIFQDITHQVEVDRLKSEFVATVSHELRTPMTSIKGYVEILLMGAAGQLSEQQAHFLEVVKQNTERLAILVNDLLDVSRIEAGRVTLSFQSVDLRDLIKQATADLEQRTKDEGKPMEVQTNLPAELPLVLGDPDRVRQIVDNLLENAYYYTPEKGTIYISACLVGDEIQVDVIDNGIGILPKDQSRIFERFFRGEDPLVLATSGTGLGLSIVQRLVEMHKGRIWFKSSGIPGEGSIFSFTLPVYQPGAEIELGNILNT